LTLIIFNYKIRLIKLIIWSKISLKRIKGESMKKHISKMLTLVCIVCASIVMFACGAKKNVNIKSIELVGSVPEYIVIGEFDNANIKIQVTYDDKDETTEIVNVTTSMIAEEDRHYLEEEGVYNVTILFKGEKLVLNVKMVEKSAVHLVKYYDGFGKFIMSEFVSDGEDAVGPSEEWLQMNGYNFIDWDRLTTDVTEDINVYGIYSKIEDTSSDETLKQKLLTANMYFEQHDHVLTSMTLGSDEDPVRENTNYHYDDGEFTAQMIIGEQGTNNYDIANITENGSTAYHYNSGEYSLEDTDTYYIEKGIEIINSGDGMLEMALLGDPDDMPLISNIIANYTATYSSALYGNRDLYTAVFRNVSSLDGDSYDLNITIVYDNEKILQIKRVALDSDGEELWNTNMYIDYTTVAFEEVDMAELMDIEEYKTELLAKITELQTTNWTARTGGLDSKTITHTTGEDTVTVGEGEGATTISLSDLIPAFVDDADYIYVDNWTIVGDSTEITIGWSNDTDYVDYGYDADGFIYLEMEIDGESMKIYFD